VHLCVDDKELKAFRCLSKEVVTQSIKVLLKFTKLFTDYQQLISAASSNSATTIEPKVIHWSCGKIAC